MQATQNITTGHVYKTDVDGIFGIVSYYPQTVVTMAVTSDDGVTVTEAIERLSKRYAGAFVRADRDTEAWGKASFRHAGSAAVISI